MIYTEKVNGSSEQAKELILGKDTVYLHKNIIEKEVGLYEYDEWQMTYAEYADYLQSKLIEEKIKVFELQGGI